LRADRERTLFFTRTHNRHPAILPVAIRTRDGWRTGATVDVSLGGMFVHTEPAERANQVIQLRIELPGGQKIEPMAYVRQVAVCEGEHPGAPGLGVELFALSEAARALWVEYIRTLRAQPRIDTCTELPKLPKATRPAAPAVVPAPPPAAPAGGPRLGTAGARPPAVAEPRPQPAAGVSAPTAVQRPVFITIAPPTTGRLENLLRRVQTASAVQVQWRGSCTQGQTVRFAIIHPVTDAELAVAAVIERVTPAASGGLVTIAARFDALAGDDRARLIAFAAISGLSGVPGRSST